MNIPLRTKARIISMLLVLVLLKVSYTEMGAGMTNSPLENNQSAFFIWDEDFAYWSSERYLHPSARFAFARSQTIQDYSAMQPAASIIGRGMLSKNRLASFLWINNPSIGIEKAHEMASLYVEEAKLEGVNHDIAFMQMCLETGFLKFTGDVCASQHNFCGLGATGNKEPGLSFASAQEGVRAHIQHLKAYASTDSLNTAWVYDRHRFVVRGSAPNYHQLTGKWASDPLYDVKISLLLNRVFSGTYASIR